MANILTLPYKVTMTFAEHVAEREAQTNKTRALGVDLVGTNAQGASLICDVVAFDKGTVLWAEPLWGYGNCVWVNHGLQPNGKYLSTRYAHGANNTYAVSTNQIVEKGQKLFTMGATGNVVGGAHVHFECILTDTELTAKKVHQDAVVPPACWVDPMLYLNSTTPAPTLPTVYTDYPVLSTKWYRVRKSPTDTKSQVGAYKSYNNALACYNKYKGVGQHLYDSDFNQIQ